jgi:quercetin dioxygenase-like cupin family protein
MSSWMKVSGKAVPLLAIILGGGFAGQALANETTMATPAEMAWADGPPVLPPGAQIAVLSGNPMQEGPFVFRLKFPAGYEIPAHTHSIAELVTVMSGTLNFGHGETFDKSKTMPVPVGSFASIPAGHPHFVWTDGEVVVQIHGDGPFDIKYIDPEDDPMKKQASK